MGFKKEYVRKYKLLYKITFNIFLFMSVIITFSLEYLERKKLIFTILILLLVNIYNMWAYIDERFRTFDREVEQ